MFDFIYNPPTVISIASELDVHFPGLILDVAFAGKIRNQNPSPVAHLRGIHMFIGRWIFLDGAYMDSTLVGKSTPPHKRSLIQGRDIGHLTHKPGKLRQLFQPFLGSALVAHF